MAENKFKVIENKVFRKDGQFNLLIRIKTHTHDVIRHCHEFYEIVYVAKGFMIHHYDNKSNLVTKGDLFYIRPGELHYYSMPQHATIYNCLFTYDIFKDEYKDLIKLPWIGDLFKVSSNRPCVRIKVDPGFGTQMQDQLNNIDNECKKKKNGWKLKARYMFYNLLVDISRYYYDKNLYKDNNEKQTYSTQLDYIYKAIEFMEANYMNSQVHNVAEYLGISCGHFYRIFKNETGSSPMEYLRNIRLAKAIELMAKKESSLTDICYATGFSNSSFFSRQFRQVLGMTPSEWKKSM